MSDYNFTDDPSPTLTTGVDSSGTVVLKRGSPQGDLLTHNFSGSTITVSINPPGSGWQVDTVTWSNGSAGVFPVPAAGSEAVYNFDYQISQPSTGTPKSLAMAGLSQLTRALLGSVSG